MINFSLQKEAPPWNLDGAFFVIDIWELGPK